MASGKRHSRGSSVTSEGLLRMRRWQKSTGAAVEVADGFSLDVDEGDTEEPLGGS